MMPLDQIAVRYRDTPIRVGMVGAGFMARGIANQIRNATPAQSLVAVSGRSSANIDKLLAEAGISGAEAQSLMWDDPFDMIQKANLDVIIDATGAVDFGARITLAAIEAKVAIVSLNAELDGTVGAILAHKARTAEVVYTNADGDQPGVQMNLIRWVRGMGFNPVVSGNIKGLHDPYRTPETQAGFAAQWGQNVNMVTSFADGTKISFEQAVVANAAGFTIPKRGMIGTEHRGHVDDLTNFYDAQKMQSLGGVVDYVVGATPAPGIYVLATHDDPKQQHYLNLYKKGEGPLYAFNTPQHLCHFEVPQSIFRAIAFGDVVLQCADAPRVGVLAVAKRDLKAGEVLDGLGGFDAYGLCETYDVMTSDRYLPMGMAEGCVLTKDVAKDTPLTEADVVKPKGRVIDQLYSEQTRMFAKAD